MYPKIEGTPMDISRFKRIGYVFDTIYNPRKTNLIKQAEQLIISCSDGLKMLVYQGLESQKYWNHYEFNDSEVENITKSVEKELFLRRLKAKGVNKIVLIGFMGCGKTTVARELSNLLNWKTLDTDSLFSNEYGAIPQFFKDYGEAKFRDIESEILKECLKNDNIIVSSGGGVIEREDNRIVLKDDKILTVFLDSSFKSIEERLKNTDRPLFQDIEKAKLLFNKRFTLYKNNCNIVINSDKSISNIIYEILKA
jgi:shikimate kinase